MTNDLKIPRELLEQALSGEKVRPTLEGRNNTCIGCGNWMPYGHQEAHEHEDGCPEEIAAKRRHWTSQIRALLAAPVVESQPVRYPTLASLLADLPDGYNKDDVAFGWNECVDNTSPPAPVVESKEPVAWICHGPKGSGLVALQWSHLPPPVGLERKIPLRAEPPAPMAVVLPERNALNTYNSHDWDEGYADGWGAYDAELKRLNPSL